ncbi:hypothetical protein SEA_PAITO_8 [Mycobacterium phage Paito]|uniref:Head-to-tail connector protein n=1 Tax=Mycobacterium phage Paito TaxID=2315544 RepID=A0A386KJL5_9CAUD|nr:hypothetical protein KDW68_gp08 [Mycobacterium phage Paito]AYD84593.1 hypothetical protein SEA_PAITO_8 [Mycobacterium phage Paito]
MRLKNEYGVVVNVPDVLGEQLAASGAWDRLSGAKSASKPAKLTAAQRRAAAKAEAEAKAKAEAEADAATAGDGGQGDGDAGDAGDAGEQ